MTPAYWEREVFVETALYFPYIRVPQSSWFTQVLLYWDTAATIVPEAVQADDVMLNQYMTDLARVGLLNYVSPFHALHEHWDVFSERFITLLNEHRASPDGPHRRWTAVHIDKLSHDVYYAMASRGLARQRKGSDSSDTSWWDVEESTASLYMAYLAGAISGRHPGFLPVSDSSRILASLAPAEGSQMARLRQLRYAVVKEALPVPAGPVDARQLADFKDKHHDQLRRLRIYLDGRLSELAAIDDDLRQVKIDQIMQEIRDDVEALREQMVKRAWPRLVLAGMGGIVAAALATASTVASGSNALALGLSVVGGIATVGKASFEAGAILRTPRYDRRAPLVYAALTKKL